MPSCVLWAKNAIAFSSLTTYTIGMPILKLAKDDEARELAFELDYLAGLTTRERFQMMFAKSRQLAKLLKRDRGPRTTQITKRT